MAHAATSIHTATPIINCQGILDITLTSYRRLPVFTRFYPQCLAVKECSLVFFGHAFTLLSSVYTVNLILLRDLRA